ncbi:MAG: VOC family protein [Thermaerobacter sp.]|nr:VOC family protein [Thermaerobacter sp.]
MAGAEGIWHFSYTVSNLERTVAFYRDLLGFEVVHEQEQANAYTDRLVGYEGAHLRVAMLKVGDQVGVSGHVLELVQYVAPKGERMNGEPKNTLAAHMALYVRDLPSIYSKLREAGVTFRSFGDGPVAIEAGRNKGGYTCYALDPDGFVVEIVQPPASFWQDR